MNKKAAQEYEEIIKQMKDMEQNIQYAINDLIIEAELESENVSRHAAMIITHLARTAADLREKSQQKKLGIIG